MFLILSYTSYYCQHNDFYKASDDLLGIAYLMSSGCNFNFLSPTKELLKDLEGKIVTFKTPDKELKFNKLVRKYYKSISDYYKHVTIGRSVSGNIIIDGTTFDRECKVRNIDSAIAKFLKENMISYKEDFSDAIRTESSLKLIPSFNELLK